MNLDTDLKDLHIEYGEETSFRNYTITVEHDELCESPREWDNLGTMVYWHRNYILGDVDGSKEYSDQDNFWLKLAGVEDEGQELDMEKIKKLALKRNVVLPLYLFDHSGITMSTSGFTCPWDSGQVGYIYISHERILKEKGKKRVSQKMREEFAKYLTDEVETFDNYITGSVYWYSVTKEDIDGEELDIDSCGGYFGYYTDDNGYMVDCIKGSIQGDIESTPQQKELF